MLNFLYQTRLYSSEIRFNTAIEAGNIPFAKKLLDSDKTLVPSLNTFLKIIDMADISLVESCILNINENETIKNGIIHALKTNNDKVVDVLINVSDATMLKKFFLEVLETEYKSKDHTAVNSMVNNPKFKNALAKIIVTFVESPILLKRALTFPSVVNIINYEYLKQMFCEATISKNKTSFEYLLDIPEFIALIKLDENDIVYQFALMMHNQDLIVSLEMKLNPEVAPNPAKKQKSEEGVVVVPAVEEGDNSYTAHYTRSINRASSSSEMPNSISRKRNREG